MNLKLTHHDVNWVYNLYHLTGKGYYLKSRYPEVRLIQCLPTSNKGLKEDFLIFSGEWHDGLSCSTKEGTLGEVLVINLCTLAYISPLFHTISASNKFSFRFNNFADRRSTISRLDLINRESLEKILQPKVFVNKADSQLRAAHVILVYRPISLAFQAPKCVIKANDPCLPRISVAFKGSVVPEGIPIPEGTPFTQSLFVGIPSVEASSSQPVVKEEKEEKEKEEEEELEGIVDLSDSQDEYEVFNRPLSPKSTSAGLDHQQEVGVITLDKMGIQRKSKRSLLDLIESQPRKDALGKSIQPKLPPPPPKSPFSPPQPSFPSKPEPIDPKRKREQNGIEVLEAGRPRPTPEDETQ